MLGIVSRYLRVHCSSLSECTDCGEKKTEEQKITIQTQKGNAEYSENTDKGHVTQPRGSQKVFQEAVICKQRPGNVRRSE